MYPYISGTSASWAGPRNDLDLPSNWTSLRAGSTCDPLPREATMDVARWLRSLGLEQYAPAFEQNHIRRELLPSLTADDLKELGIASVGHRRELLEAIV